MESETLPPFINHLEIQHFKSIRSLRMPCKRVNVLIGEPNTGKSNILEALSLFSPPSLGNVQKGNAIRVSRMNHLFFNYELDQNISCKANFGPEIEPLAYEIEYSHNEFVYRKGEYAPLIWDVTGEVKVSQGELSQRVKFYLFSPNTRFQDSRDAYLTPPFGENLPSILMQDKSLRKSVAPFFSKYGLKLAVKALENQIELQKEVDDIVIAYPYSSVSDTLRRMVFYLAAIETNHSSILCFEEPEAFAFPAYIKELAEKIAVDESNQYFLTTHSPYVLLNLVEKTPQADIQVIVTYFDAETHETRAYPLAPEELSEIIDMGSGTFFNLDLFREKV